MGIKNLNKFITENFPEVIRYKNLSDLSGKIIAIDASNILYKKVINSRKNGYDLVNSDNMIVSHILGLFNNTIQLLLHNIIPIYVFDGEPDDIKNKTLECRSKIKNKAQEKLLTANNIEEKIKYFKRTVVITSEQIEQCKELLDYMGVPYVEAEEEADSEMAELCKNNLVDGVLTEDMDILTFGSPNIIKNLFSNNLPIYEINQKELLQKLNLNFEQFVELCILFGCDYCEHLNIKPSIIYNIYIKNKSIETTLNELKNNGHKIPSEFNYMDAKKYFLSSVHSNNKYNFKLKKPDLGKLLKLLVKDCELLRNKIVPKITKLYLYYQNQVKSKSLKDLSNIIK